MSPIELEPPRWKNGPPICPVANLPAFKDEKAMKKFMGSMLGDSLLTWQCRCGNWHYWAKPYAPAGATSGSARAYEPPKKIVLLSKGLL